MATSQWLQDNPKVLAYVPKELHNKLHQFKKSQKLKSISEAINLILRDFFKLGDPLAQPAQASDNSQQTSVIESRIATLEAVIRQLADSVSDIKRDLPIAEQKALTQDNSMKSDLLLSSSSKSLNLQPETLFLPQANPRLQNQDQAHPPQEDQDLSRTRSAQEKELSKEEIDKFTSSKDGLNSASQGLVNSHNNVHISDVSISFIPTANSVITTASNLPLSTSQCLTEEGFEHSDLLLLSSRSLNLQNPAPLSSQLNLPSEAQGEMPLSQKKKGEISATQISRNKELSKEEVSQSIYFKGSLGLLDRGLIDSSSSIGFLAKSILVNPSCVCLSVLRKSRLMRLINPYSNFHLEDVKYYVKVLHRKRKSPYFLLQDNLNRLISDTENPLKLDQYGKSITVFDARDLALSVKQIRRKDDIVEVYVIAVLCQVQHTFNPEALAS